METLSDYAVFVFKTKRSDLVRMMVQNAGLFC